MPLREQFQKNPLLSHARAGEYDLPVLSGMTQGNHHIVVALGSHDGTPPLLSTAEPGYSKRGESGGSGCECIAAVWIAEVGATPPTTLVIANTGANEYLTCYQFEVSGLDNADLEEDSNFDIQSGGIATFDIASITPLENDTYCLAGASVNSAAEGPLDNPGHTLTQGTNWTVVDHHNHTGQSYENSSVVLEQIQTTAQATNVVTVDGENGNIEGAWFVIAFNAGATDTDPPVASATSFVEGAGPPVADIGFTFDENCDYDIWITNNVLPEDEADIAANSDRSGSATGSTPVTETDVLGVTPGTASYAHIRAEDGSANVGVTVLGPLNTVHYGESETHLGGLIPPKSMFYISDGNADDGSTTSMEDAQMVDGADDPIVADALNGARLEDRTQSPIDSAIVIDTLLSPTRVTFAIGAGSPDFTGGGQLYSFVMAVVNGDILYVPSTVTASGNKVVLKGYIYDLSLLEYSGVFEKTYDVTVANATYNVALAADGSPSFTLPSAGGGADKGLVGGGPLGGGPVAGGKIIKTMIN